MTKVGCSWSARSDISQRYDDITVNVMTNRAHAPTEPAAAGDVSTAHGFGFTVHGRSVDEKRATPELMACVSAAVSCNGR